MANLTQNQIQEKLNTQTTTNMYLENTFGDTEVLGANNQANQMNPQLNEIGSRLATVNGTIMANGNKSDTIQSNGNIINVH